MKTELIPYLRIIHIVAATFWVGANVFMAFFIYPAIKKSDESGGEFSKALASTNNFPLWMNLSALLTLLSGISLIGILSQGFSASYFIPANGMGLAIGGLLAIAAFFHGFFYIRPCGIKLAEIGKNISSGKLKMNSELKNTILELNNSIASSTIKESVLLVSSLLLMIISKYL